MGEDVPEPVPVTAPEETRGGETPGDWKCGTAAEQAAQMMKYIKDNYGKGSETE